MGILSNSINLIAKSISKFTSLSSNLWIFSPVTTTAFRKIQTHTPVLVSDLKQHYKLRLLVSHEHKGSRNFSLLSTDQNLWNDHNLYFTFSRGHAIGSGHHHYLRPAASCNAMLLSYIDSRHRAALWNPTTDEVKKLPESSVSRPPFITDEYIHTYGFGFDPASQDYKVIRFLEFMYKNGTESLGDFQVELYSPKIDSWKEIAYPHNHFDTPLQEYSIHINGFYYWAVLFGRGAIIVSFDFANEKFSSAHIPLTETEKLRDEPSNFLLAKFHGSLAVLVYAHADLLGTDEKPFEFEIWVWKDESWTRVSVIDVPSAAVEYPLGLFKNDNFYFQDFMGEVLLFNCAKRQLKNLGLNDDPRNLAYIFPHVESSAPFHSMEIK